MNTNTNNADAPAATADELHWEDFLWALGAVCELRNLPFDGELFVRQFPPPYTVAQLAAVLNAQGIPVHLGTTDALRGRTNLPCLAFQRVAGARPQDPPRRIAIIARCDRRQAVAVNAQSRGAFSVPLALLNEVFEPLVLYFPVA